MASKSHVSMIGWTMAANSEKRQVSVAHPGMWVNRSLTYNRTLYAFNSHQNKTKTMLTPKFCMRDVLHCRHESEIGSRRRHNIFVKSPTSQQFGHGSRMRKVENAVRFSRRSQNDGIEISGDVDDGIAGLHPIDVVIVSIFIIIEQVVDVLENEQRTTVTIGRMYRALS